MITEIYADTLFAINFSMDFLALFLTGKICHTEIKGKRLVPASLVGALYSILLIFLPTDSFFMKTVVLALSVGCAIGMVRIAFPITNQRLVRSVFVFGGVNIALGGLMTVLYSFLGKWVPHAGEQTSEKAPLPFFPLFAIISAVVTLLYDRLRKPLSVKECRVLIEAFGNQKEWPALCDSGNLLTDPISGRPVIILSSSAAGAFLPEELSFSWNDPAAADQLPYRIAKKLRVIPSCGVCGEKLLTAFVPDHVTVKTGKESYAVEAIIAIGERDQKYADFDVILPECFC